MSIGPVEILIVIVMILCLLAGPILILIGLLMLFRRVGKVEQAVETLQGKEAPGGNQPDTDQAPEETASS